jgi:hypothetical protein
VGITVPAVPGYELVPGADLGGKFDYGCPQSAAEGICKLYAPIQVGTRVRPGLPLRGAAPASASAACLLVPPAPVRGPCSRLRQQYQALSGNSLHPGSGDLRGWDAQ